MSFTRIIFLHEWRQLKRQGWLLAAIILFVLIALLSIGSGYQAVESRLIQADSIQQTYARDFAVVREKIADTSSEKSKRDALSAGKPVMINFRLPQITIRQDAPLSPLSLGMSDMQPWHHQVKYTRDYQQKEEAPVNNPVSLFAGSFDLAFVIVFILPLLVIIFSFSVLAEEKDAGTLSMLMVQAGNMERIIRLKFVFRFLLLAACLLLINLVAFIVTSGLTGFSGFDALVWIVVSITYLAFWISIAYMIVAMARSAAITGLMLTGVWLLILIILPSVINTFVQTTNPVPMRDEIDSYRREAGEEIWRMQPAVLADSFTAMHPEYNASIDIKVDTVRLSDRSLAGYYALLKARMERKLAPYQQAIDQRNQHFEQLAIWNPALFTQRMLNSVSGNDLQSYRSFKQQINDFQLKWQQTLYPYHFSDRSLHEKELMQLPVFSFVKITFPIMQWVWYELLLCALVIGLLLLAAFNMRRRKASL